jgi:hypothetical protein
MKIELDEVTVADIGWVLTGYKFKLCEPPRHDGRQDVWLAAVARRDAQLDCVKQLLKIVNGMTKAKGSKAVEKAFN